MNHYTELCFPLFLPKDGNLKYLSAILPSCIIFSFSWPEFKFTFITVLLFPLWWFSCVEKTWRRHEDKRKPCESAFRMTTLFTFPVLLSGKVLISTVTCDCSFEVGFYAFCGQCQRPGQGHLFHRLSGKCKVKLPLLTLGLTFNLEGCGGHEHRCTSPR